MIWWDFYFLAKLYLHFRGYIHAEFLLNLLLLAFLWLPLPERRGGRLKAARTALGCALAGLILWRESWLPPIGEALRFLIDPRVSPSPGYALRFLAGAINPWVIAALGAILLATLAAARKGLRLTPVVLLLLAAIPVMEPSALTLDRAQREYASFYESESKRVARLGEASGGPDFDVVILHVCSLSWEDLRVAGLEDHPFFSRFDVLFTRFNSASSYSNPAAIRLLRSSCGQSPHQGLYREARSECYLMEGLRRAGYRTYSASNHNGKYDDFAEEIRRHGRADPPMDVSELRPDKLNFDGSPIFGDLDALGKWRRIRQESGVRRAALYYNTVSLHQGAHSPGQPGSWVRDRIIHYKDFTRRFFENMDRFFAILEASHRNVVVLFVSEHGAALEGTRIQAPDLRDIPLPQITEVPVAVKLIGPGLRGRKLSQLRVAKPVSYLALSYLLASFLKHPPFGPQGIDSDEILAGLPEARFVAESESARVMQSAGRFLYKGKGRKWIQLTEDVARMPEIPDGPGETKP